MTRLEELRRNRERLESLLEQTEKVVESLEIALAEYRKVQGVLVMDLNRARRLEREELQNAEH